MTQHAQIRVPAPPGEPTRAPFPVMASIAPVIAAVAIWAITRSPYVLMFAILGPVIAIAGMMDSRLTGRRRARRQEREYREGIREIEALLDEQHAAEREARLTQTPTAREVLDNAGRVTRWRAPDQRRRVVAVGLGDRSSSLSLTGATDAPENEDLCRTASIVSDAPCTVDASRGIAVLGPQVLSRAVVRGYLLQLCHAGDPRTIRIVSLPDAGWEWAKHLPHAASAGDADVTVRVIEESSLTAPPADVTLAVCESVETAPASCAELITCDTTTTASWQSADDPSNVHDLTIHPVTAVAAAAYAKRLAALAADTGVLSAYGTPPDAVVWADLSHEAPGSGTRVVVGRSSHGDVAVDLVEHGPHAVIGGTTGSGKSELLSTWALGLAARNTPEEVALLLVDFKGGATFAPLQTLPHVVGVITDLDPHGATRALESLKAEVMYRERTLRERGVHDASQVASLGRLVIIVDEFAAMLDGFPELHALFVDIAARGRSLGMHLVLCTQRPTGVVRDSLLANCTLRLSLRVNNRADSTAVIGVETAASLPVDPPGRCVVVVPDRDPETVQIGRVQPADIADVARRHAGSAPPRRPWLDPLPTDIPLSSLPLSADAFVVGMADLPREQRQEVAQWRPHADGSLLALGASRAGKSTLAACLAQQTGERWQVTVLSDDLERAFDQLEHLAGQSEHSGSTPVKRGTVLVIDDLDALVGRLSDDDADHAISLLTRVLRTGPRAGVWVVATAQRLARGMNSLSALFDTTIMMRMSSRQEHILAGGDSAAFSDERPAGSAVWNGITVQLASVNALSRSHEASAAPPLEVGASETVLVCSPRPQQTAARLRERHPDAAVTTLTPGSTAPRGDESPSQVILVGDADAWQVNWSLLASLRITATLVVEACSPADYRAITRSRARPPYLHSRPGRAWRIANDGVITRCTL
ncbi:FtsK/SpoIIIE domain-containing protein [Paramicrobacterium agarici]|uniref:FtsK/SpoIIIE domain-containing protein n=1 Tax=Paramicrobacterium agarici TaxID=630514 RepID=UPI001154DC0D|nr:FtsK/SpoIIIE domain-containing protein [Microbacterium agarici]TQO24012.1 S-DNA-T family DNA segregation ATPase FtsK/SpoIIIE [Microbacterium agarici]